MAAEPRRVALVGVEGSGKSTIARLLAARSPSGERRVVLSATRAHENPDGPLHGLSRHLAALSRAADGLGSPDLKLAVLYLRLCTYGPVERFFTGDLGVRTVISERHPIVDALARLPAYRAAVDRVTRPGRPDALRAQLARLAAADVEAAEDWCARLPYAPDLTTVAAELVALLDRPPAVRIAELAARFRVDPPDTAVHLDVGTATALRRVRDRPPGSADLERVRAGYDQALKDLDTVDVHRVLVDGRPPDELAAEVDRCL
ncbi:hypothetical protein [Spirillospora sp. CA-294931]|uniref:hypothetical protein n=1 Tax=Spirillospora sp. CA-294931 TaxID=3240042 RepID=UPI003D907F8C